MTLEEAKEEVRLYVTQRKRPGVLVLGVLSDRLYSVVAYGNRDSDTWLRDLVTFVFGEVPRESYGSVESVQRWLARKVG